MPTAPLSDRLLRSLAVGAGERVDYLDTRLRDFGVRVSGDSGRITFFVRYRTPRGRRRQSLGTYPVVPLADARHRAKELLLAVAKGGDPAGEAKGNPDASVEELAILYLERHAKARKRSWKEDERQLQRIILPAIGSLPIREVKRSDLVRILDSIVDRGAPVQANRTRALLGRLFSFAMDRDLVDLSPAQRLPREEERPRERVLLPDELRRLWAALDSEDSPMADAFRLLTYTGQRPGEILGIHRSELEEAGFLSLPGSRTKNKRPHRVPLSQQAESVLARVWDAARDSDWAFPSPRGTGPLRWTGKATERFRDAAGLGDVSRQRLSPLDFQPRDLRRTVATNLEALGASRPVVRRILNHVDPTVTGVYARHSFDAEAREALQRWADHLDGITGGRP